jgi:hypothetical protein
VLRRLTSTGITSSTRRGCHTRRRAWPPGSRATTSQYAHSRWQASGRSEVSAAQALTVVGSVGHRTGVRHQGVAVSCRHGQGPGRRSPVLVSAAAADRMAAIAGLLAGRTGIGCRTLRRGGAPTARRSRRSVGVPILRSDGAGQGSRLRIVALGRVRAGKPSPSTSPTPTVTCDDGPRTIRRGNRLVTSGAR